MNPRWTFGHGTKSVIVVIGAVEEELALFVLGGDERLLDDGIRHKEFPTIHADAA